MDCFQGSWTNIVAGVVEASWEESYTKFKTYCFDLDGYILTNCPSFCIFLNMS